MSMHIDKNVDCSIISKSYILCGGLPTMPGSIDVRHLPSVQATATHLARTWCTKSSGFE